MEVLGLVHCHPFPQQCFLLFWEELPSVWPDVFEVPTGYHHPDRLSVIPALAPWRVGLRQETLSPPWRRIRRAFLGPAVAVGERVGHHLAAPHCGWCASISPLADCMPPHKRALTQITEFASTPASSRGCPPSRTHGHVGASNRQAESHQHSCSPSWWHQMSWEAPAGLLTLCLLFAILLDTGAAAAAGTRSKHCQAQALRHRRGRPSVLSPVPRYRRTRNRRCHAHPPTLWSELLLHVLSRIKDTTCEKTSSKLSLTTCPSHL